ncbi:Trp biosynthesis-associated membrane protein [Arthrobacter sp. 35W]|uniref:Trp biosynthesis-associated membrane protein n=1 Tax=Arthrobacter sp. 35W TaxID=1132441 RepID=UPI0003F72CE1|nr:Trp biosynthesis-associated membrane protein [Arthrobacter sp. 35W]
MTQKWYARKSTLVMLAVAAALAVFGTTTQTWLHIDLAQGEVQQADLNVAGSKAAVAVSALALVALAGSLAASIAGKVARVVAGAIVGLSAVGIAAASLGVVLDPAAAASGPVGTATGVIGQQINASTTIFPVLAVVAAVVLAATAVAIIIAGRGWRTRSKYDTPQTTVGAAATDATQAGGGAAEGPAEPLDDIEQWDRLSRGEDPTS